MTPFGVTWLSVTLNAAGMVPSAINRFPEHIDQIVLDQRLKQIATAPYVQIRPGLLLEVSDFFGNIAA